MIRNVSAVDMDKVNSHTDVKSESHSENKISGSSDGTNTSSNSDLSETNRTENTLPNVKVLIRNSLRSDGHCETASFASDVCKHNQQGSCAACCKTFNRFGSDEEEQQIINMDVKYEADQKPYDRMRFQCPVHGGDIVYSDCAECCNHHSVNALRSEGLGDVGSDAVSPASALIASDLSHQTMLQSFCESRNLVPISAMSFSIHRMQQPHMMNLEGHENIIRTSSKSPNVFNCQNHISLWEQENEKCIDYAWRNDVYCGRALVDGNIIGGNSISTTFPGNNVITNSQSGTEDRFNKIYISEGSSARISVSNNRRRRKRVQTPGQRTAANMRERRRMCHLNVAFDRLKERLPNIKNKQKLSRIQTLKAAIDYIHFLKESLSLC